MKVRTPDLGSRNGDADDCADNKMVPIRRKFTTVDSHNRETTYFRTLACMRYSGVIFY